MPLALEETAEHCKARTKLEDHARWVSSLSPPVHSLASRKEGPCGLIVQLREKLTVA
jgi:hypothetical protein